MVRLGLQLYSVKEDCAEDFLGTIARIGQIGYHGVEFAGFYGTPAADVRQTLADNGLVAAASHHGIDALREDMDAIIGYAQAIDCPTIICPGFGGDRIREVFSQIAALFNAFGQSCEAAGLHFAYHIHGHEFVDLDGMTGMQILLDETDPALVSFEPDTYWIERGGGNAVQFIKDHGERCTFIHFKDWKERDEWHDVEIGDGMLDVRGVIAAARGTPVEWYIVEQEAFERPRMDAVEISLNNLKRLAQSA